MGKSVTERIEAYEKKRKDQNQGEENSSSSRGSVAERIKAYEAKRQANSATKTQRKAQTTSIYDKKYQGYSYDQVKSAMQKVGQDTDEYKYLSEYGVNVGYNDLRDYDANLADLQDKRILDKAAGAADRLLDVFGRQGLSDGFKTETSYRDRLENARNQYALDHTFDLYKDYLDKADFEEMSRYDDSKAISALEKVTGSDVSNAYKFINNVDGMMDSITEGGNMRGVGYDKLSDEEKGVFNYIWNTEGEVAARDFLKEMEVTLSKRSYEEDKAVLEKAVSTPVGAAAMSVLSVPASIAGGALSMVDTAVSTVTGQKYNPYSAMKGMTNFATDTREMVGQQIADSTNLEVGGVNVGQFLYNTGMSMADSATMAWMFGPAGSYLMGTSAATQTAKELVEAGEDSATVALTAGAAGIAEALFEHVSLENLLKARDVESFGGLLWETMKQAGVEASEEVFTEVSNIITDTVFRGGTSNLAQDLHNYLSAGYGEETARRMVLSGIVRDIGTAAVGGALSGGIMGGAFEGARLHEMKSIGKQINENATDEDLREIVGVELKDGLSTKDHVSAKDYMAGKNGTLTDAQSGLLYTKALTDAKTMFDETAGSTYVNLGEYRSNMELYDRISSKLFEEKSTEEKERIKARRTMNVGESTAIGNKEVGLQTVDHDEDGKMVLVTSEGERVAPSEITLSKNDAKIVSYAEKMDADMAEAFVSGYDGSSDVDAYVDSFNLAYEYGRLGFGSENVLRNRGVLTDRQAVAAYTAGIKGRAVAQQAKVNAVVAKHKGVAIKGKLDDSVIDYSNSGKGKVNYRDLTSKQKQAVQFVKAFSKATGVNITFTVSDVVNGERKGENGSYNPNTNTITLDVYAGIDNTTVLEDALIPTLSHELTHWMKGKAPELYAEMREIVMNTMGKEFAGRADINDVVAAKMAGMKSKHSDMNVTEEMAVDELIAYACEDMLSKSNVDFLARLSQKQRKTLADRVKQAIADLKAWVKDLLDVYSSKSTEARILRKYEAELDKLSKTWDKALEAALEANRALVAEGVTGEQAPELSAQEQYSDRDSDGRILSAEQMAYFAKSKVRDKKGNLLVMYHGTPNGNHTTFRSGTYFTENPDYAEIYQNPGASMLSSRKTVDNPKTYKVYLNITKPFDTRKAKERRIFMNEYYRKYGTGAPLAESGLPDWTDGMDLQEFIEEMEYDYDGLILDEGAVGGYGEDVISRGLSYVVFSSNQVKNVDNATPTESVDIRYSDRISSEDELSLYNLEGKWNDYVGVQKEVIGVLREKGFFDHTDYTNAESGMVVRVTAKGIKETLGKGNRFQTLPKRLKVRKVATLRILPMLIETGHIIADDVENIHEEGGYKFAYISNRIVIDDEAVGVRISVKKKAGSNHFWIHNIDEYKNGSELLSPSRGTENNETRNLLSSVTHDVDDVKLYFSDRETESIYDKLGETDRILAENEKLKADVQRLRDRLALERKVTGGKMLKDKDLADTARKILNYYSSGYSKQEFADGLKEIYGYILESEDIEWYTIMSMASDLSRKALKDAGVKVINSYAKSVMKEIRNKAISLSDTQLQELKNVYGEDYKKVLRGRVKLKADGIALDSQWQEWAWQYPDMFNADVNEGDQITALLDVYDALEETAETIHRFNTEEDVRQMALEIYNQFWNVGTVTTLADKYEGQIKRMKYEHRQMVSELRSTYKERAERDKLAQRIADARYYNRIVQHREAEIQRVRAAGKKRMSDYKDRQARDAKVKKIIGNVKKLNDWLVTNSKDKHIPEVMKGSVSYLLSAIDPSSKRFLRTGEATKKDESLWKALDKVRQMAANMNSPLISARDVDQAFDTFFDLPVGFVDELQELCNEVNKLVEQIGDDRYILNEMSLEQLESLDKIVTVLKKTITQANKCMAIKHGAEIATLSKSSIKYLDAMGQTKVAGKIADFLQFDNALPYYTFRRFGEAGKKVFEALQDGWDRFAFNVKTVLDFSENAYTADEVKKWSHDVHSIKLEDGTIQMTTAQIMSLYCLSKREQAQQHLFGGGIRIADIENGMQKIMQAKGVTLTLEELNDIISMLSKRQMEVADQLQNFMNTICADWGNAVSMMRFGIHQFTEENYFPIQSDRNNMSVDDATDTENTLYRLLNMSFTKSLTKNANNAVVISDVFDVFAQHSSDMAKYNALALPVLDAFKWYNFKDKVPKGEGSSQFNTFSVKKSMEGAYGKGAQKYFRTFMEDMNGAESGGRGEEFSKKMMSNYKVAAVAANLRVAILQPTAYVRASCVIDPKYLLRGLSMKPQLGKAKQHCGMALWKSLGFYDTSITKGVQELIKHEESVADKIKDYSMKLAEWGDSITWGYLWNACESEIRDTRSDLRIGSDEFNKVVADRLREIIYHTQVVDSTMTRTHLMRSKSALAQMGTAFMSEPMLSYNMAADCAFDWMYDAKVNGKQMSGHYKRKALRSFGAFVATATASSLAAALIDSIRDGWEDEDDEYADKLDVYFKNVLENMGSAINPLEWIPWAKDVISMFNGYEPTRMDEAFLTSIMYAARKTMSRIHGTGRASDYNLVYSWMKALSQTSGLPFGNFMRDVVGFWNWTFGSWWDFLHIDTE